MQKSYQTDSLYSCGTEIHEESNDWRIKKQMCCNVNRSQ